MCEETKCDWKCKKPNMCPRPKCELQCDKPACEAKKPKKHKKRSGCCKCSDKNVKASITSANKALIESGAHEQQAENLPSFLEVYHTIKHAEREGAERCCDCA